MKLKQVGSNRAILTLDNGTQVGFSYQTPVVARVGNESFRTEQKFSVTTSKHCGQLLAHMGGSKVATVAPQSFFDELGARA